MPLKLKRENGQIVAVGENPVIVDESGNESTFDIEGTIKAVKARNQEASELREKLARFKPLGDVDPVKAAEALELVSKLDAKKLLDAYRGCDHLLDFAAAGKTARELAKPAFDRIETIDEPLVEVAAARRGADRGRGRYAAISPSEESASNCSATKMLEPVGTQSARCSR